MSAPDFPLEIGAPLPKADIMLQDVSGKDITLNKARQSNGILVMFSGNECPYIERNKARTQEICKYALSNNIGVVLINANGNASIAAMKAYAAEQQYNWYYVADNKGELVDAFEATHMPECYLFNQNAKLVYKGSIDDNPGNADAVKSRHLNNAINDMLANKALKVNTTATIGCNIKRF
ncbi:AhpC/TSA family protein [Chitinophaga sp. CF118]|nr:AhpC/TSA family protein [Chitinophaga sp. CF118]